MTERKGSRSVPLSSRVRNHLRSNAYGLVAIFIALGGTAVALPGKNSVRSDDIAKGQVRSADIARGAVRAPKLAAGAVGSIAVGDDALGGADVDESSLGTVPSATSAAGAETATNAGLLDGIDSAGFLQPGSVAGGALGGPYSNLSIDNGAVTPAMHGGIPSVITFFATWGPGAPPASCTHDFPSGSEGVLRWGSELWFTSGVQHAGGCVDPESSKLIAPIRGAYEVNASIFWPVNPTGVRSIAITSNLNGQLATTRGPAANGEPTFQSVSTLALLNAGDYIEISAYQTSGTTLDPPNFDLRTSASMHWVGPGPP